MSLPSPSSAPGRPAPCPRPDPEGLLLDAIRRRQSDVCLDRIQRCVHRRGVTWLDCFLSHTLPRLEGEEARIWCRDVLQQSITLTASPLVTATDGAQVEPPGQSLPHAEPAGHGLSSAELSSPIEFRATAAVDGAIAAMLAEFPELDPHGSNPGLGYPPELMAIPPVPSVPQVLPGRLPPAVFPFGQPPAVEPLADPRDQVEQQGIGEHTGLEEGAFALQERGHGRLHGDPAAWQPPLVDGSAARLRNAAGHGTDLAARWLRQLSQSEWAVRIRGRLPSPAQAPGLFRALGGPADHRDHDRPSPPAPEVPQLVDESRMEQPALTAPSLAVQAPGDRVEPEPQDTLAAVVRLVDRRPRSTQSPDVAPAPAALADLRAWLPDSSLRRAS